MSKPTRVFLDHSVRELVVSRFFSVTSISFDPEMGKRLLAARNKMGLTQSQLADKLGLTQADICRLEKGKNLYAPPKTQMFKNVLGNHFEHVLFEDGFYRKDEVSVEYNKTIRKQVGSKAT